MALAWVLLLRFARGVPSNDSRFIIDAQDRRLKDLFGRERYFRGLNVVYKSPPWHPELYTFDPTTSFTEEDFNHFKEWGLNVVRLGIMWPGVRAAL